MPYNAYIFFYVFFHTLQSFIFVDLSIKMTHQNVHCSNTRLVLQKKKKTHELMVKLNHTITKIQFVAEVFFFYFIKFIFNLYQPMLNMKFNFKHFFLM
jgi:hypothetical protein